MSKRTLRLALASLAALALLPALAGMLSPILNNLRRLDAARIATVTAQYPNSSADQTAALAREIQSQLHPAWKTLSFSQRAARLATLTERLLQARAAATDAQVSANFLGNLTVINALPGDSIGLQRQSDCSLSLFNGTYALSLNPTIDVLSTTPHYELTLHAAAGLSTKADVFASGCADSSIGIGSRRGMALGNIAANVMMFAGSGYDNTAGTNALYVGTLNTGTQQIQSFAADVSLPDIGAIAAGDLNGDGLMDVVGLNSTAATISVWLAKSDGTVAAPTVYTLPGTVAEAATVADVNGDGKLDVVVATNDASHQERISVLTGNGNGTLNPAQSSTIATPTSGSSSFPLATLIAADIRGGGHVDLVGSNGIVLLNDGSGVFTAGSAAFTPSIASSSYGPNLAAADFNKDGKLDLAVGHGGDVDLYLGNGDGTFTVGKSYRSIGDVGYLTATDLDGDGNIDVYVGLANGGFFGGDQFEVNQAYALMGNGDGTFQGAPSLPFTYTGTNIVDLNGDKNLDAVGLSGFSFISYLGDGKGNFSAAHALSASPVTLGGTSYALESIDSSALGDVNGDGIPDLAYIPRIPSMTGGPGLFVALGDGHGGFGAPAFYALPAAPSSLTSGYTVYPTISNLHLADVNHDGKADLIYYYTYSYQNASNVASTDAGTAIQLSNGDGTFQAPQQIVFYSGADLLLNSSNGISDGIPYQAYVQLVSDLNKDGNLDLIYIADTQIALQTPYSATPAIQVALGHGDGTFSAPTTVAGPTILQQPGSGTLGSLAIGDMNGDGIPDIVALGSSSADDVQVAVALGNGDGSFKAPLLTNYTAQFVNDAQGIGLADFNGDGKLDIVMTDPYDPAGAGISFGNGDGTLQTFTAASLVEPNLGIALGLAGAAFTADFNGDGKPDVIAGNTMLLSQAAAAGTTIATTTTLTSSAATIAPGAALMLSAKVVAGSGTAAPTGSVTFLDGTTSLGVVALGADGSASFTSSTLSAGSHTLSASYAGGATFAASTSAATTVVVGTGGDFVVALSSAAGSIAPGQSVTTNVTLTPTAGFNQSVSLSCAGLPLGASCNFSPAPLPVNGAAATSTLTITSTAAAVANASRGLDPLMPGGLLLAGLSVPLGLRRRRQPRGIARLAIPVALFMGAASMLHGCGGGAHGGGAIGTPAGTYTVTVSATAGSTTHTATYQLTVS